MSNKINWDIMIGDEIKDVGKLNLPDPDTLEYYRIIYWNSDVDECLVDYSLKIIEWNKEDKNIPVSDRKIIKVYVNSDGGDLESVMNFINVMQLSKTPIHTIALAKVYSAGGLMLMAGHKRFIFQDTAFLLHDGSTGAFGNTGKVMDNLEFTKKIEEKTKAFVLKNTKIDSKAYDKNYRRDWWMLSDDIIKYGVADSIIIDLDEII
jgi:ATP-dependent Clp protease protease subunit